MSAESFARWLARVEADDRARRHALSPAALPALRAEWHVTTDPPSPEAAEQVRRLLASLKGIAQ